jgi:hypothetical protein
VRRRHLEGGASLDGVELGEEVRGEAGQAALHTRGRGRRVRVVDEDEDEDEDREGTKTSGASIGEKGEETRTRCGARRQRDAVLTWMAAGVHSNTHRSASRTCGQIEIR